MKKIPLTCNQLMVLLDCYRGTFRRNRHMACVDKDVERLIKKGLLKWHQDELECTEAGTGRVKDNLG